LDLTLLGLVLALPLTTTLRLLPAAARGKAEDARIGGEVSPAGRTVFGRDLDRR
jgi:hypothetical protein